MGRTGLDIASAFHATARARYKTLFKQLSLNPKNPRISYKEGLVRTMITPPAFSTALQLNLPEGLAQNRHPLVGFQSISQEAIHILSLSLHLGGMFRRRGHSSIFQFPYLPSKTLDLKTGTLKTG